jgi:SulP family sulfate permease
MTFLRVHYHFQYHYKISLPGDAEMTQAYRFNRMEISGSLGDLGTILPLAMGMVLINGIPVTGIFYSVGIFYIIAGAYFGVPVPVQPMKVISAYAIATGVTAAQISGSAALVCLALLLIGLTGTIDFIGRFIPKSVIRGVQLSTGVLLIGQGLKLIVGKAPYQQLMGAGEPFLNVQHLGPVPITIILGTIGTLITLYFLRSKKYPAGIIVLGFGLLMGALWGTHEGFSTIQPGFYLPSLLPLGIPTSTDFTVALFILVLPQMPMTIGNAIIANADLSKDYFGEHSKKVTYKAATLSMGLANGLAFLIGGIPICHGAGGLAAHYKFGARTGGSNLIIGLFFLALALFFGPHSLTLIHLLPLSLLGVLLIFAGSQLGLSILDMFSRKDMFVILIMLCITLTSNLSWGFAIGLVLAHLFKSERIEI